MNKGPDLGSPYYGLWYFRGLYWGPVLGNCHVLVRLALGSAQ